jgi:cell division protein FtsA
MLKDNISGKKGAEQQNVVVGLDIGTSKICALVAAPGEYQGQLNILGLGITESKGVARGFINNIENTVKSIEEVIRQAEQQSGVKIEEVIVGIAGDHVESEEARGIIGNIGEITETDVLRVIEETRKIRIPADRRILHVIPQEFIVDGQEKIYDPVGFSAVRMEALANIITCKSSYIDTIYRCVERAGLRVKEVVLEPIASSVAVLEEDEKEVGAALIDIGGGTTDIAIFEKGILRFTSIFAIAGKKVTDDIQKGLGILVRDAEKIKKEYGYTYLSSLNRDEIFMIPGIGGRNPKEISKNLLCQVIQPRMEEIFEFALSEIERSGLRTSLGAGVVITGGCSLLRGTEELATEVFGTQIKIGVPSNLIYGLAPEVENPMYSTAVGLVLYGIEKQKNNYNISKNGNGRDKKNHNTKSISRFFKKVQEAISNL